MRLTVKYSSGETQVYLDTPENIDALIRELRNNKSTYYWYVLDKISL